MRQRGGIPATLLGLCLALAGLSAPAAESAEQAAIDRLVEQLGSDDFAERQKATEKLDAVGVPALEALRKAAHGTVPEVRKRALGLVAAIEGRTENADYLTPKRVTLTYKDTPLKEALADFRKQSGYDLTLQDPENKLADVKVTLDTGKVTFWDALERFCTAAGLDEFNPALGTFPAEGVRAPVPVPLPVRPIRRGPAGVGVPAGFAVEVKPLPVVAEAPVAPAVVPAVPVVPPAPPPPAVVPIARLGAARAILPYYRMTGTGQILLVPAERRRTYPADSTSAVRVRALAGTPLFGGSTEKEIVLALEVATEPRLRMQRVVSVRVERALDDADQDLKMGMASETPSGGAIRVIGAGGVMILPAGGFSLTSNVSGAGHSLLHPLRLTKADRPSKVIKELQGTVLADVLGPARPLLVADVVKATDMEVKGEEGGRLKILEAQKNAAGQYIVRFEMDVPAGVVPDNKQVQIEMPAPLPPGKPLPLAPAVPMAVPPLARPITHFWAQTMGVSLRDDRDNELTARVQPVWRAAPGGKPSMEYLLVYQPKAEDREPSKLVFSGRKKASLNVPFTIRDIRLP